MLRCIYELGVREATLDAGWASLRLAFNIKFGLSLLAKPLTGGVLRTNGFEWLTYTD